MADPKQCDTDFDMSHFINESHFANEFILDSDEGSPLPDLNDSDDASPRPHRPHSAFADSYHAIPDAPMDCGSPSEALGLVSTSSRSPDGPRGSTTTFGSASSKGTSVTALTQLTTGDMRMDVGANGKNGWDMVTGAFRGPNAPTFTMTDGAFEYLSGPATAQSSMQSPMDSPSPFGSALTTLSPEAIMASPPAFDDSYLPFTFKPPGLQSDATTSASLCMRPQQPAVAPKYEFRASQEPGAVAAGISGILDAIYPNTSQLTTGPQFFPHPTHIPAQPPVEHHQYGPGPYTLEVGATNTKSRVETQITIKLRLSHLPLGVTKVHLPKHTISKPKFWTKPPPQPSPDTLEMHAMLVCTSAMQVPQQKAAALQRAKQAAGLRKNKLASAETEGEQEQVKTQEGGEVRICENCIGRERKRAGRKKSKHPQDEEAWRQDEARRVIVFNTQEVKEWALQNHPESGSRRYWQVEAPMRIACYCRHHAEKQGFQLIFTLTDHLGQPVAQTMSESIMITDDHKTSPNPVLKPVPGAPTAMLSPREEMPAQSGPGPSVESSPSLDLQAARRSSSGSTPILAVPPEQLQPALAAQHLSRPASPSFHSGPAKRRRGNNSTTKIPTDLAMTPLDTSFLPHSRVPNSAPGTAMMTPARSAFSPTPPPAFPPPADLQMFGPGAAAPDASTNPFGNNPQASGNNSQLLLPNLGTSMFGMQPSARQNSVVSPAAPRPAPIAAAVQGRTQQPPTQRAIFKVIPGEGPIAGGIEVTLMGQGFDAGMQVMFGDKQAPGTMYWSSESLVCLLPPSEMASMVPVTIKGLNLAPQWFRYVDDSEQQLLRTALMILGNKMTGGYEDPTEFARRIIKESSSSYPSPGADMSGVEGSSNRGMENFEGHLLKLMELMDLSNSTRKPRLNLRRRTTGQTMLHLACKMGLHRFVAGLLARGANPDPRDNGGYTALHMASMSNHTEIVRLLISHGADPTLRTLSGLTAAEVAKSKEVVRIIQRFEQHRRSQSDSSSHSRVNSVASFKSLRAQVSLSQEVADTSSDEPGPEEESSEEYSEAYSSDIPEESGPSEPIELRLRRGKSGANTPARVRSPSRPRRRGTDATGALMAAIREQVAAQFQQLQQRMGPHLQYLPQLPQLPQMPQLPQLPQFPQFAQLPNFPQIPNMPPLPEYQNPVLQRLATMIGGARPGAGEDEPANRGPESAWHYLSPFSTKATTPPPAYDELFPQGDLDTKRTSAAQAAADAVADAKCATLFDQAETSTTAAGRSTTVENTASTATVEDKDEDSEGQEIPALLQIGRKDAITREQQATLRRAHAQNLKRLSWDRNLFFFWIPLLILMVGAMIYHGMPGFVAATRGPAVGVSKVQAQVEVPAVAVADVHQAVVGGAEGIAAAVV